MLGFIGFMLSPLSWWNDAFVNLPVALLFGWVVALVHPPAFEASVIGGYWLTNIAGLVLMHKGIARALGQSQAKRYSLRDLVRDLVISAAYTGFIVLLIKLGVLQPLTHYFDRKSM